MCGIAGYVTIAPEDGSQAILRGMTDRLAHRGPDGFGYYQDQHANLGHRRLSIIDLATGQQPMSNASGSLWLSYNGEIFNHAVLREELQNLGCQYRTKSDTETILHAYRQYGAGCVEHFRGMFSFALWDKDAQVLFCARDRLGIKPFYYIWDGGLFAFGSEIKAVLAHPAVPTAFEEHALPEYLASGYLTGERTLFQKVRKLMPGHWLLLDLKRSNPEPQIVQYWDVPQPGPAEARPDGDWIQECRQRLEEAVETRLMSDVPLGMFLSGGVDSSAIAALIRRKTSGPVKTFSVGYREAEFSELSYAAEVARTIGTEHHETVIGMEDFFQALPDLIWHEDEPIAWPSSVSLYFVSRLAAQQVKVVLTGEGADELFAGYKRYAWQLLNEKGMRYYGVIPPGMRGWVRGQIATSSLLSASVRRKLNHTFVGRKENLESVYLDSFYGAFSAEQQRELLGHEPVGVYGDYLRYWSSRPQASSLQRMLYADQKTYLVELLMKQDQMSMACSVESRVPFLDHPFVEFATRVPDRLKIRGNTQKYILKKAVEDLIPHEILYRKKMGFPTPLSQWFRDPKAEPLWEALRARDGFLGCYLNPDAVKSLIERQRSGLEDATDRLWRLLNLQIWGDIYITGRKERWREGALVSESAASGA
jgi:asparagine synthase (glutamine-hydrolysing)